MFHVQTSNCVKLLPLTNSVDGGPFWQTQSARYASPSLSSKPWYVVTKHVLLVSAYTFLLRVTMQVGSILRRVFTLVTSYLSEYKEAFALFDKKGTGAVPRETLGDLLRALGQNPTQAEVADIVASAPREGT